MDSLARFEIEVFSYNPFRANDICYALRNLYGAEDVRFHSDSIVVHGERPLPRGISHEDFWDSIRAITERANGGRSPRLRMALRWIEDEPAEEVIVQNLH